MYSEQFEDRVEKLDGVVGVLKASINGPRVSGNTRVVCLVHSIQNKQILSFFWEIIIKIKAKLKRNGLLFALVVGVQEANRRNINWFL